MADQYSGGQLGYGAEYDRLAAELKRIQDDNESKIRAGAGWTINSADFMNRQMAITNRMNDIRSGRAAGNDAINSAISTAQQGVGVAGAGAGVMRGDAAAMRGQARLVNTQAGQVNQSADALAALVPKLDPYAQKLGGYGDELAALGRSLTEQANDVFGQGGALVSLDPTKGGLSAEFIKQYGYLSPDRYVSRATSDVESSFANAEQQMGRQNARRGVSAGSGAGMTLRQQLDRALAVARAAAKTNARQQGIDEQTKMLSTMTGAASTLYNMGSQTQSQATAALGAAGDAQKGAAGIVTAQGNLLGDTGRLRAIAGQLFGSAADIFGGAARIEGGAAELELSALKNLQAAYSDAAQYYLGIMSNAMRGGGGGGGGSTRISKAADEGGSSADTGAWVDLTHGKASHADGAQWVWDPNAPAAPAGE